MIYKGFPDLHDTIERARIIAEGDKVWVRVKVSGTHNGEYRGLAPPGKKITVTFVGIYRIVDGKAVERWSAYDKLDFYKQLGLIEYTEKEKKFFFLFPFSPVKLTLNYWF
jgi:predicted ester cyclase